MPILAIYVTAWLVLWVIHTNKCGTVQLNFWIMSCNLYPLPTVFHVSLNFKLAIGTRTLCFLKFLLCRYALTPNTHYALSFQHFADYSKLALYDSDYKL